MRIKMILPALTEATSPFWGLEPLWNFMIKTRGLNQMLPLLERILSTNKGRRNTGAPSPFPAIA